MDIPKIEFPKHLFDEKNLSAVDRAQFEQLKLGFERTIMTDWKLMSHQIPWLMHESVFTHNVLADIDSKLSKSSIEDIPGIKVQLAQVNAQLAEMISRTSDLPKIKDKVETWDRVHSFFTYLLGSGGLIGILFLILNYFKKP